MFVAVFDPDKDECTHTVEVISAVTLESSDGILTRVMPSEQALLDQALVATERADVVVYELDGEQSRGLALVRELFDRGFTGQVICTAHDDRRVLDALDAGTMNYVIKGRSDYDTRLTRAIVLAGRFVRRQRDYSLIVTSINGREKIPLSSIRYFSVDHHQVSCFWGDGECVEFNSSLEDVTNRLGEFGFLRCHRGYVVNASHVVSIRQRAISLTRGDELPLGRSYRQSFREGLYRYRTLRRLPVEL